MNIAKGFEVLVPWGDILAHSSAFRVTSGTNRAHVVWECEGLPSSLTPQLTNRPLQAAHSTTDSLWKKTCFEVFVRSRQSGVYQEWNFAPDFQWNTYGFGGVRRVLPNRLWPGPQKFGIEAQGQHCRIECEVGWENLAELCRAESAGLLDIWVTAILFDGSKTQYWATQHFSGKADFHQPGLGRPLQRFLKTS